MRALLPSLLLVVFLAAPSGWHFTRTGQERVALIDRGSAPLAMSLVKGEWKVSVQAPVNLKYRLFICHEKGSRVCSRVQGELSVDHSGRAVVEYRSQ